jgi:hypothetical protein
MTTTITLEVEDNLMGTLRDVCRRQRAAGSRSGQIITELSEQSDGDVIVELVRDAYQGDIRRQRNHGPSGGVVGADRRCQSE